MFKVTLPPPTRPLTLTFASLVALSSGTNYAFSSFGPQLSHRLSLSSTSLNLIALSGNAGLYLSGPLIGIAVDRRGPKEVLVFAAVVLGVGYLGIKMTYDGGLDGILFSTFGIGSLSFFEILTGFGSSAGLASACNGVAKSFSSKRRGLAMGITISCFGLSSFFYATLAHALPSSNPTSSALLLFSLGCTISMLLGSLFVRPVLDPPTSIAPPLSRSTSSYSSIPTEEEPLFPDEELECAREGWEIPSDHELEAIAKKEMEELALDIKGWELVKSVDAWILFSMIGLCSGIGLMYINNIGTIVRTLDTVTKDDKEISRDQSYLVSLLSVFNCLGRLLMGFFSDYFSHHAPLQYRINRTWFLVPMSTLFVLSQYMASHTSSVAGLYGLSLPTAVLGTAYGSLWALTPVLCVEWFGLKSFGTNNGLLCLAPAIFGNLTNLIFGRIYDSHVLAGELICKEGKACFESAFGVTLAMSMCAVGVGTVAGWRKSVKK